jgi:hypothetical protein
MLTSASSLFLAKGRDILISDSRRLSIGAYYMS